MDQAEREGKGSPCSTVGSPVPKRIPHTLCQERGRALSITACGSRWVLNEVQDLLEVLLAAFPYHFVLEATMELSGEERRQLLQSLAQEEPTKTTPIATLEVAEARIEEETEPKVPRRDEEVQEEAPVGTTAIQTCRGFVHITREIVWNLPSALWRPIGLLQALEVLCQSLRS